MRRLLKVVVVMVVSRLGWEAAVPADGGETSGAAPASTAGTPASWPAPPVPTVPPRPNPVAAFRQLLGGSSEERDKALQGKSEKQRQYLADRLKEFDALSPAEREVRLRLMELRFYLMPLLRVEPAQRAEALAAVPPEERGLIDARLQAWDRLSPEHQSELLQNESALTMLFPFGATGASQPVSVPSTWSPQRREQLEMDLARWKALPEAKRERVAHNFNRLFELSPGQQEKALSGLSETNRVQMQKALAAFEKLPPEQRARCLAAFNRFTLMSEAEKERFLQNAARWQAMTPEERRAWRSFTAGIPVLSQPPPPPPPPPPHADEVAVEGPGIQVIDMRRRWFLWLCAGGSLGLRAQQETFTLDEVLESGGQWLRENVDDRVLEAFGNPDPQRLQELFGPLQRRFQGEYVLDLASLRESARRLVPLLQKTQETRPYAAWLKARLDYFDVAEELRLVVPAPPTRPGKPVQPAPNPTPEQQRKVWQQQLDQRPVPSGAAGYVKQLKPVFAGQKVPPALVWLAEVESGFDPSARSPAGAVGLYQLMPATAKSLGLALKPKDERLNPEKNGRAAAKYLGYLHGKFKDWRLALAGYNAGEGRVGSLLNQARTRTFDGIAARLPAETQMYVPKVEATLRRREGVTLASLARN